MFYFTNYFENEYKGRTVKSIKYLLDGMRTCMDQYQQETPLSDININDIEKLTQSGERIGLLCRASLEEREKLNSNYFEDSYEALCTQDLPVTFKYDDGSIIITSPITLKKGMQKVQPGHYQLSDYLKAAAIKWQRANPDIDLKNLPEFSERLIAVVTRRALTYNRNIHCDNDNLELGRLINTLCSILGIGDNCTKLDVLSRFRECLSDEECGTEIVITSVKNASKYI